MSGPETPYPNPDDDPDDDRQSSSGRWAKVVEAAIALVERIIFDPTDVPRRRLTRLLAWAGILLLLGIGLGVAWRWGVPTVDALNELALVWAHVKELMTQG